MIEGVGLMVAGFEWIIWMLLSLLMVVWSAALPVTPIMLMAVWAMFAFAGYDYYQGKKHGEHSISANRFFSLQVITFVMALSWLDFSTALTGLTLFNALLWAAHGLRACRSKRQLALDAKEDITSRKPQGGGEAVMPAWAEVAKNYAPLLLLVWVLRSFVIQPYHVPTGSLEPTLLPHELILVKQYQYGLRFPAWPVFNRDIVPLGKPKRGDIALFRNPEDEKILLIKRVVGLPGDRIAYRDKKLYINGKFAEQQPVDEKTSMAIDNVPHASKQAMFIEQLAEAGKHYIYQSTAPAIQASETQWQVPQGMYFMMGDNRDNSYDSRFWGFVPERNLVGKAWFVFMSWDKAHHVRWQRIGAKL
jgi:signal peptidase I